MPFVKPDALQQVERVCIQHSGLLHSTNYIRGLVFAVCAAPEIPMPDTWLQWAFKGQGGAISGSEVDRVAEVLMGLLQYELAQMRLNNLDFPGRGVPLPDDLTEPLAVSEWLQGVLAGHSRLESIWRSCWQEVEAKEPDKLKKFQRDLKHCLLMFSSFADIPMAIAQAKKVNNHKLLDNLPKIYASLPEALKTYVELSGRLAQFLPEQFETFEQPRS